MLRPVNAERWIPDQPMNPRLPFWTRANAGEVVPGPVSPASWDLYFNDCLMGWRDCGVNRLGMGDDEVDPVRPEVSGVFGGYLYLNATFTRIWAERTPGMSAAMIDAAYYGDHPDVPPYVAEPWHENPRTGEVMTGWLGWVMGTMEQDELEADRLLAHDIRRARPDLAAATDAELVERAASIGPACRRLFNQHINQSAAASIGPGAIAGICTAVGRPADALKLISGLGGVDSAAPSYAMWDLSRTVRASAALTALFDGGPGVAARLAAADGEEAAAFRASVAAFLAEWGSRGPNEWDVLTDTWETDPDLLFALVDRMRLLDDGQAPALHTADREAERSRVAAEIAALLQADPEASGTFAAALASSATFVPGRERSKTNIIRVIGEARVALRELGRRAVTRGHLERPRDLCLLFGDELRAYADGTATDIGAVVAGRLAHLRRLEELEPPFIINGTVPPVDTWPTRAAHRTEAAAPGTVITGMPGCAGIVTGRAAVVLDPSDPTALEPGDILVAPLTDPAWTPLFVPAAAVVVDVGAALSHAIIVSRELGIPCVVSATDATRRIPHGATIEVNGDTGTVTVLALP